MALIGGVQFVERQTFFNGQRLFASDLQSLESFNTEMRELHNMTLHAAGVASGYAVSGAKGDRQVTITPGYALDACGHEIVLTQPSVQQIPPVADDGAGNPVFYDLTVSYPQDSDLVESETRQGICSPAGAVKLREAPNFCWIKLGADMQPVDPQLNIDVRTNMRILLARAEIKNCQLNQPISVAQRRNARMPTLPHIACGSTDPTTAKWTVVLDSGSDPIGLELIVDTTDGQFAIAPCYIAHVIGERFFTDTIGPLAAVGPAAPGAPAAPAAPPAAPAPAAAAGPPAGAGGAAAATPSFAIDGYVSVTNPTATGFTLHMLTPNLLGNLINPPSFFQDLTAMRARLAQNGWSVVWMGVEP